MSLTQSVITVGNFDGVHLGHQRLLREARRVADNNGHRVVVATFSEHPASVLRPDHAPRPLTDITQRQSMLLRYGADEIAWLTPKPELLNLSPERFVESIVAEHQPAVWLEGPDFRFGHKRAGDMELLGRLGGSLGFEVRTVEPVSVRLADQSETIVSSSLVRFLIAHGRVEDAARSFGRTFAVRGRVMRGEGVGRQIGFPTANVDTADRLLPADGVYGGYADMDGRAVLAAISVGTKPTFGEYDRVLEAYLLDFSQDLYDRTIDIHITRWLRDQWRFNNTEDLISQINRDVERVRLECDPASPTAHAAR